MNNLGFILRMAWRDSRASRRRLLVYSLSILLGVAALVAIASFRRSLAQAIDDQARTLVGADMVVSSNRPFSPEIEKILAFRGAVLASETRFSTMATFPGQRTRLVNLRALRGDFPFYGRMETEPANAVTALSENGKAIIDESLLFQFGVKPGDRIAFGGRDFQIAAALRKMPGDATAGASFAPRVYISLDDLAGLNLLGQGSIARYRVYLAFPHGTAVEQKIAELTRELPPGFQVETVAKRKRDLGESLDNLYRFLNLVGFVALLLGAIGMASAISAHLRQKVRTGAILRCLGCSSAAVALVYFLQVLAMGLIGAILGGLLGLGVQASLLRALRSLLPFEIPATVEWSSLGLGLSLGAGFCLLFALPPLLRFRFASPLLTLRAAAGENKGNALLWRDPLLLFAYFSLGGAVVLFAGWQLQSWLRGLVFALTLGVACLVFAAVARLIILLVRRLLPRRLPFSWRQGLANLHRPNNRTQLLVISLGLGTFLLLALQLTRDLLLAQFRDLDRNNQPNIFLFDIQADQQQPVAELVQSLGFPILQRAPIVTMRLAEVKGRKSADLLADPQRRIPEWELQREYRSTYREQLASTEKITAGRWVNRIDYGPGDIVPISLDLEIAHDLGVGLGDKLVFDVQGVAITTEIASLRQIDWKRFQTNFFVVFPAGVLEKAPGFEVLVSRASSPAESARLQNAVVAKFPNVSAIDLAAVIQTVDSVLGKVALAIRLISLFTIVTGLIVVASAIWSGRYQRVEESVLLRTLGASRGQIWQILGAEYFFLGFLASLTGVILAAAASWALAVFVFKIQYTFTVWPLVMAAALTTALTVILGLLTSRGVTSAPPLQILRAEAA